MDPHGYRPDGTWIRVGAVGLFLQEFNHLQPDFQVRSYGISLWIGVALILMGVSVCLLSMFRHLRMLKQLEAGESLYLRSPRLVTGVALALVVLGLVMAGYLIFANPITLVHASIRQEKPMAASAENGIVRIPSNHSVDETAAKLQGILQVKGVKLFLVVDHSGEAASAGLKMPNTKLLIFGNPKAGTLLMLASPSVALDLPLKILVTEDASGKTWISYNAPAYLQSRHSLLAELLPNIAVIETLAAKAAE